MSETEAVSIPERLTRRPLYRGMVLPYSVAYDEETGIADFRVTDTRRWYECIRRQLCAMCGEPLLYWCWYIGGRQCADQGVYFDLGMHEECCRYAAAVCPFLATGRGYSDREIRLEGWDANYRADIHVPEDKMLFASKRRRDQCRIVRNGSGGPMVVETGPEVERIQIWPK